MPIRTIFRYSSAALVCAFAACAAWLILRLPRILKNGKPDYRREGLYIAVIAYLAALIQITALRIGLVSHDLFGGSVNPIPLMTTIREARAGLGNLIYHVIGNIIWFVPLGFFLPLIRKNARAWQAFIVGAALSFMVECGQFILGTGVSDADDIWLNALGALMGFCLFRLWAGIRRRTGHGS